MDPPSGRMPTPLTTKASQLWSYYVTPKLSASAVASKAKSTQGAAPEQRYSRWGYVKSFTPFASRVARPYEALPGEERVVSFPQWAVFRAGRDNESPSIEIVCSGYAYRARPIAQASRSQRVFFNLAKRLASLPPIPAHLKRASDPPAEEEVSDYTPATLDGQGERLAEQTDLLDLSEGKDDMLAKLVQVGSREDTIGNLEVEAAAERIVAQEEAVPETETASRRPKLGRNFSAPHLAGRLKHPFRTSTAPSPFKPPVSSRTNTMSSDLDEPAPLRHNEWPTPFSYTPNQLPQLHANLQSRLLPFFGQKLAQRKLKISVHLVLSTGEALQEAILQQVVESKVGGGFKETLHVSAPRLKRFLDAQKLEMKALEGLSVRLVVDLLALENSSSDEMNAVTGSDDLILRVAEDAGLRVISDIDDTIKHTEVLGGARTIFRNVFVRELDQIKIPGMVDWYRAMADQGASFHYVSNSPFELYSSVVEPFLAGGAFPAGSVTLKEYGGGGSMVTKLFEDAGLRKRAGVVSLIAAFPASQFALVGDSGEQDLNLYVSLAQQYPRQIKAIFIRDVTTPFTPTAHSATYMEDQDQGEIPFLDSPSISSTTFDFPGAFTAEPEELSTGSLIRPRRLLRSQTDPPRNRSSPTIAVSSATDPSPPIAAPEEATEERVALIEAFYARLVAAERDLPKSVKLRIFRHGKECQDEALHILSQVKS